MPENFEPYNLEKAQEKAKKIKDIVGSEGKSEDYIAAHDLVEEENFGKVKQEAISKLYSFLSRVGGGSYDSRYAEESLRNARSLQQKFNIPAGELEADPQLQEKAKQAMLKKLSSVYSSYDLQQVEAIKSNLFLSDEVYTQPEFQEAARKAASNGLTSYLEEVNRWGSNSSEEHLQVARSLQQKFNIPAGELEADPKIQEEAKESLLSKLRSVRSPYDLKKLEEIKSNLFVSDEVYTQPEFQEAAKRSAKSKLFDYLGEFNRSRAHPNEYLQVARSLQQKFNIPAGELEADPQLQEKAKQAMLKKLSSVYSLYDLQQVEAIKSNLFLSDEVYTQPEFQEAAKRSAKSKLFDYLGEFNRSRAHPNEYLQVARSLQQKFNIPAGELEADPQLQEKAKQAMLKKLSSGYVNEFEEIKSNIFASDDLYALPEFQEAAKKAVISKIGNYVSSYLSSYLYLPSDKDLQEALDIKRKFNIDDQSFAETSHVLILNNLKFGNVNNVVKIQEIFSISNEKLLSPEYVALAEQALFANFERGDKDSIEKIKEKFLPDLNVADFIKTQYTGYINEEKWNLVIKLKSYFSECEPIFQEFFAEQKEIAKNNKLAFSERRKAFDILSGLAKNGEASVSQEFSEIITARTKQKETPDSKWGLDPLQESAFYTLMRLDNSDSNRALFSLVFNEDVNSTVKYAVLKKLLRNDSGFLNNQFKENLHAWLYSASPKKADWRDLQFIGEIQKIPSKELRGKSFQSLSILKNFDLSTFPLYKTWSEKYSNIPQNVFLQVLELDWACESEGLLDKFQKLFTSIRKESSKKDGLLYGITNVLETDPQILKLFGEKLENIDFGSKQDAESLSELLRRIVFLSRIEKIKSYYQSDDDRDDRDEEYEEQSQERQLPPEILEIFSKEAKNLNELVSLVKEVATRKFQEILPNENITAEKIEAIEKEWGDLEPIFTYLGRFPSLKEYVAEIVANMDTAENWKNWRYDLKKEGVKNQIGHLSEEQIEIWKGEYFSEIGDIIVAETGSDKPKQIQHILQDAVLQHRHIFSPEMGQNKNEFISKTLEAMFAEIAKTPDKKTEIIDREIKNVLSDAKNIDAIINFNNLPRVRQGVELVLSASTEITPSSKIKNTVSFISAFLPTKLRKVLEDNYSRLENQKKMVADELFTSEMKQAVEQRAREIEENYKSAMDSNIWEKFQLDKNNAKNLEQFYQKRQELKSAIDLLRLLDLSNKLIATNRIAEKEGKKGGETITSVLERLKKYFKDSPLVQDISNVEFILKEKIDFGEKRRLAMVFTDNAQMLWQAGKYPLGNGSCQHYAEGSYANQLMGYVGDPNCKVAYLVDLNRLSQDIKNEIEERGIEEAKDRIPKQDLLNASLARSIIKMTKDRKEEPVILLEPTYTVVYKGDVSMDRYFNLFIDLMVAEPMKAKMARGGGNDSVIKGHSLSPEGQYEDLNLNGVKFIHKLSKPTKEEIEVMERIRSSR
jgi:hypothetical protein